MVKIRVECGEDVDQRDQVLVFSSLCNFVRNLKPVSRTVIKTDNITGKFANFSGFFFPYLAIVSGYSDLSMFTMCLENGPESVIL